METQMLNSTHPTTEGQCKTFRQHGHIRLNEVATQDEVSTFREAIRAFVEQHSRKVPPLRERTDTYARAFLQHTNLWELDNMVRQFTTSARFARIAAELMGVSGVRLYHDQALFKEAGGGHTPWHQDHYYWP